MLSHRIPRSVVARPRSRHGGLSLVELLVVLAFLTLVIAFFFPAVRMSGEAARRSHCNCNLKQIGIALHVYHEVHGCFPPAYTVDANGRKLHSWRTLILPYLEQGPLYNSIDLSKPWDDPANAAAFRIALNSYRCPSVEHAENHTTYLAIVTPNSCLQPRADRRLDEITDGPSHTLIVVEVAARHAVPWMSPHDADEDLVLSHFAAGTSLPHEGVYGLHADCSVRYFAADMPPDRIRAAMTINGADDQRE